MYLPLGHQTQLINLTHTINSLISLTNKEMKLKEMKWSGWPPAHNQQQRKLKDLSFIGAEGRINHFIHSISSNQSNKTIQSPIIAKEVRKCVSNKLI